MRREEETQWVSVGARALNSAAAVEGRGGGSNSVVESQPSKLLVAGSIPVSRSIFGDVSQTSLVTSVWRLICR